MSMYGKDYDNPETPDPAGEHIDGAALLDKVDEFLSRFVAFPSDETRHAAVLWAAHTHAIEAFDTTGRLAFFSPERESGKTRALEILSLLVPRPMHTMNVTPAYMTRRVATSPPPTVLFDEVDVLYTKKDTGDITAVLNSGYKRGATAGRCVTQGSKVKTVDLPSFAAVALAGIGEDIPDALLSRCIIVRMKRRRRDEKVSPFRHRDDSPDGLALRRDLAAWAEHHYDALEAARPDLPEGIEDRRAEAWEPLVAIGDIAGGVWGKRARLAAIADLSSLRSTEGTDHHRMLRDVRRAMKGDETIHTETLIARLTQLPESEWRDLSFGRTLTPSILAGMLRRYTTRDNEPIKPKQVWLNGMNKRGYTADQFIDAWERHLHEDDDE